MKALFMLVAAVMLTVSPAMAAEKKIPITIASASSGGAWYPLGGAIAEMFKQNIPNSITSVGPGGGISNIFSVSANKAQMGFGFPADIHNAIAGKDEFDGKPIANIRAVTALYPGILHIATRPDKGINSIEDLKGKTLCVQQRGNTAEKMARVVLMAYGMSYDDLRKVNYVSFSEAADLIKDGHADALAYMSTFPYPAMQDLAESAGVKLLPIDDAHIATLLETSPGFNAYDIPAGAYKGMTEPVQAIEATTILFTNAEMPEEVVYQMTKTIYENREKLILVNKSMAAMTGETGHKVGGVELHPGAIRYFKEIGAL